MFNNKIFITMKKPIKKNAQVEIKESKTDKLFLIVKTPDGYKIGVANAIVTAKTFKTVQQAEDYISSKPYELLINTCIFIMTLNNEKKNENENTSKGTEQSAQEVQ